MEAFENLSIDTPEQTVLEYPIAGLGSRFLGVLTDTAITVLFMIVVFILAAVLADRLTFVSKLAPQWILALITFVMFLLNWGYYAIFETLWNGQTPGKRIAKIRVIKDDGRPIGAYEAIIRNLLRVIDFIPGMYGVGLLTIFMNRQAKRVGDFVAGTVVVHERTMEGVRPYEQGAIDATIPPLDVSQVTLEEVQLIESFLNRREAMEPGVRSSMAWQITYRLMDKVGVKIYGWPRTEHFLEAVIETCREAGKFRG